MPRLLLRKLPLTAPLAFQPRPVCLVPVFIPRVIRLEEKRNTNNREPQRIVWIERRLLHRLHRALQLTLPDVPVGSHGIRNQLNRHELVLSSHRQPRHRPGRRRHRPLSSLLRKHLLLLLLLSLFLLLFYRIVHVFVRVSRRQREPVHGFAKAHDNLIRGNFRALHVHQSLDDRVRNLFTYFRSAARFRQPAFSRQRNETTRRRRRFVPFTSSVFPPALFARSLLRRHPSRVDPSIHPSDRRPLHDFVVVVVVVVVVAVATHQAMCTNGIDARASVKRRAPSQREPPGETDARTDGRTERERERERADANPTTKERLRGDADDDAPRERATRRERRRTKRRGRGRRHSR